MGKIMVVGRVEREYVPDMCGINLGIEITRKTASEASIVSSEQCEQILSKLQNDLGIEPNLIRIAADIITKNSRYHSDEIRYESKKSLRLYTPADMKIVNAIRALIETGFEDVTFVTKYTISNESELHKELLKEAIADSRSKAELLAESMGLKISGIDSADLSGDGDVYDLTEEDETEYGGMYCADELNVRVLSDQIEPEHITLGAIVKVVWLVE